MIKAFVRKLFAVDTYFTIALQKRQGDLIERLHFHAGHTLPATRQRWCADPFLVEGDHHTYLFYESVHGDLGSIVVSELRPDLSLSDPVLLFGGGTHYSYPYIFQKDERWYMIPESSSLGEVALYAAESFPTKWKKETVLLQEPGVDTTVFQSGAQWYLLTFLPVPGSERVQPRAYQWNGLHLEAMYWDQFDPLRVRGAGHPFLYRGDLVRPVQVSTDQSYGNRIAFVKMEIEGDNYRETAFAELPPEAVKAEARFYDGLHTYNASEHYAVIDIRCGKLSPWKPFRRVAHAVFKK